LKMDFTTLFHVQKGAACLGFEPECSVTLDFLFVEFLMSGERKNTGP